MSDVRFKTPKQVYVLLCAKKWRILEVYDREPFVLKGERITIEVPKSAYNIKVRTTSLKNPTKSEKLSFETPQRSSILKNVRVRHVKGGERLGGDGTNLIALGEDGLILSSSLNNDKRGLMLFKGSDYIVEGEPVSKMPCFIDAPSYDRSEKINAEKAINPFTSYVSKPTKTKVDEKSALKEHSKNDEDDEDDDDDDDAICVNYDVPRSTPCYDAFSNDVGAPRSAFDAGNFGHDSWLKRAHFSPSDPTLSSFLSSLPTTSKQKKHFVSETSNGDSSKYIKELSSESKRLHLTLRLMRDANKTNNTMAYATVETKLKVTDNPYAVITPESKDKKTLFFLKKKNNRSPASINARSDALNDALFDWNVKKSLSASSDSKEPDVDSRRLYSKKSKAPIRARMASVQESESSLPVVSYENPIQTTSSSTSDFRSTGDYSNVDRFVFQKDVVEKKRPTITDEEIVGFTDSEPQKRGKNSKGTFCDRFFGTETIPLRYDKRSGTTFELKSDDMFVPCLPLVQTVLNVSQSADVDDVISTSVKSAFLKHFLILDVLPWVKKEPLNVESAKSFYDICRKDRRFVKNVKRSTRLNHFKAVETNVVDSFGESIKRKRDSKSYDLNDYVGRDDDDDDDDDDDYAIIGSNEGLSVFDESFGTPNEVFGSGVLNDYSRTFTVTDYDEPDDRALQAVSLKTKKHVKSIKERTVEKEKSEITDSEVEQASLDWDVSVTEKPASSSSSTKKKRADETHLEVVEHDLNVEANLVSRRSSRFLSTFSEKNASETVPDHFNQYVESNDDDGSGNADSHVLGYLVVCMADSIVVVTKDGKKSYAFGSVAKTFAIDDKKDDERVAFAKKRYVQYLFRHLKSTQSSFFDYCNELLSRSSKGEYGMDGSDLQDYLSANENDVFDDWIDDPSSFKTKRNYHYYERFLNQPLFHNVVVLPVSRRWCLEKESQNQIAFEKHAHDQKVVGHYDVYRYYFWNMTVHYQTKKWVSR